MHKSKDQTITPLAAAQASLEEASAKLEQSRRAAADADRRAEAALDDHDRCAADAEAIRVTREAFELRAREARAAHAAVKVAERDHVATIEAAQRAELDEIEQRLNAGGGVRVYLARLAVERARLDEEHERAILAIDGKAQARLVDHKEARARSIELSNILQLPAPRYEPLPAATWQAVQGLARFDAAVAAGRPVDLRSHVRALRAVFAPKLDYVLGLEYARARDIERVFPLEAQRAALLDGSFDARVREIEAQAEAKREENRARSRAEKAAKAQAEAEQRRSDAQGERPDRAAAGAATVAIGPRALGL